MPVNDSLIAAVQASLSSLSPNNHPIAPAVSTNKMLPTATLPSASPTGASASVIALANPVRTQGIIFHAVTATSVANPIESRAFSITKSFVNRIVLPNFCKNVSSSLSQIPFNWFQNSTIFLPGSSPNKNSADKVIVLPIFSVNVSSSLSQVVFRLFQ